MSEEQKSSSSGERQPEGDIWQQMGKQFQSLGESMAQVMRTAWENEENQRRLNEMRQGLESMVNEVGQAIQETANSPKGQQLKADAEQAARSVRDAGEKTVQEVRPHVIQALQNLNEELQKLTERLEKGSSGGGQSTPKGE